MKNLIFVFLFMCSAIYGIAQEKGDLTVNIEVVKDKGEGQLVFMLFDQEDGFPREPAKAKVIGQVSEVRANSTHTFTDIPFGKYAICVFHDKNNNGEIDSNFMGMPREYVAASNMTRLGKPTFDKCAIRLDQKNKTIVLNFIND